MAKQNPEEVLRTRQLFTDRLVDRLQEDLQAWEASPEEVLRATEGTFLRARRELGLAISDLVRAVRIAWQGYCIALGSLFRRR